MNRLMEALVRRSGFAFSRTARRSFRYLAQYYPPFYYDGFLQKTAGFDALLREIDDCGIRGDVVECGVGRGLSLYVLGFFMSRRDHDRRLYGFDSFEGFPAPTPFDESPRRPLKGDLWSDTSLRHVREHFHVGLDTFFETRVSIVPGFFSATLPGRSDPREIALLNLDVDLYESYLMCLQHLGPRVTGVIVYDEYASPKWPGATRAVDEQLPLLKHLLFKSGVMSRYVSMPASSEETEFGRAIRRALQLETVRPA
jgi:hypothetical protein